MWILKSLTPLLVIIFIVIIFVGCEKLDISRSCDDVCCKEGKQEASSKNLRTAFKQCCNQSTNCLLPEGFYNASCAEHFIKFCNPGNRSITTNLTSLVQRCCRNVNCSGNSTETNENQRRKCFKVTVHWEKVIFPAHHDLLIQKWEKENWEFFLKMATQFCLNNGSKSLEKSSVKFKYPFYTKPENYNKQIVYGYCPPPAFLVMNREQHATFTVVSDSFKNLWLTMFLCVTWTLISGVIIWMLDHRKNPHEFPSSFWQGVCEGAWWAVVTMTTVGYGDKSPKSLLARIYSAVWMVVGMIIFSIFTAEVASGLASKELRPRDSFLGKQIGVPAFSKRHFFEELIGGKITEMNSSEALVDVLNNKDEPVNRIVLHDCGKIQGHESLQSVRALKTHIVGITIIFENGNIPFLVDCVRSMIEQHHGDNKILMDEDPPECEEKFLIDKDEYGFRKGFDPTDGSSLILYASLGVVVVMFVAGSLWDFIKSKELQQQEGVHVDDNGSVQIDPADGEQIEITVIKEDGTHSTGYKV